MNHIDVSDYEAAARAVLAQQAYDYYASGADEEHTLRDNRAAFDRYRLRFRVLRDVRQRSLTTTVLGHDLAMPVLIAPTAFHGMAHPEAECATVRAAGRAGTVMILSTLANTAIEDVTAAATGPVWFQLYVYKDRAATQGLIARAEAAGCTALVLTVDTPILGRRLRDVRNGFRLPEGLSVKNLLPAGIEAFPDTDGSGLAAYVAALFDPALTWKDVDWLCAQTRLPVLLKGIVHPDDARLAVEHGAAGVVVSNHGGRQLDSSPATLDALPAVAEAIDGRIPVLLDGGIRRGTDVVKALALGAQAVAVGRPVLWGLAVDGEDGVAEVLALLRDELDRALALCGCPTLADIAPADLLM